MPVDFDPLPAPEAAPAPRPARRSETVSPADPVEMGGVSISFEDFEQMDKPIIVVIETPDAPDTQPNAPDTLQADFRTGRVEGITQPRFQEGGFDDFRRWVNARVRKPEELALSGIKSRVIHQICIDTLGQLTIVRLLQSPDRTLTAETERVLRASPRWTPGERDGKKVAVTYWIAVDFRTQD